MRERPHRRPVARPGLDRCHVLLGGVAAGLHQSMQTGRALVDVQRLDERLFTRGIGFAADRVVGDPEVLDVSGDDLGRAGGGRR